ARRAGRGAERDGDRRAHGERPQRAPGARLRRDDHRARRTADHAALRPDPRSRLRAHDRGGLARRDPTEPCRHRGLPRLRRLMLVIENLHVAYGRITALRGVSLQIPPGTVVALIGPNGAGKSTTLSTVVGLRAPREGSITLDGRPLVGLPPEEIVRLGVALVPENR